MLDEPFNNLDAILRSRLVPEVREVLDRTRTTDLLVTHDRNEAFAFARRVAVLRDGAIEQADCPENLYHRPATPYVARLMGAASIVPASPGGGGWITPFGPVVGLSPLATAGQGTAVCLRPRELAVAESGSADDAAGIAGVVTDVSFQGERRVASVRIQGDGMEAVLVQLDPGQVIAAGDAVRVHLRGPVGAELPPV